METDVILEATSFMYRYGFEDGDILNSILFEAYDGKFPKNGNYVFHHVVLYHLVKTKLVPLIPGGVSLRYIVTSHNPVRFEYPEFYVEEELEKISVYVTQKEILLAATYIDVLWSIGLCGIPAEDDPSNIGD